MSGAVALLDESGDAGAKPGRGSSARFTVGLVVFSQATEAALCRECIIHICIDLRKPSGCEFHFRSNSHGTRTAFLAAVAAYEFVYYAATLAKPAGGRDEAASLCADAVTRVCTLAGEVLNEALLIVDGDTNDRHARVQLAATLRSRVNGQMGQDALAEVRVQDSARNDLLQLAHYATGVASWLARAKRGAEHYRRLLHAREGAVRESR